ncbi:MAG: 2-dehydropantoate 2-reductase [Rhodospirillaceae bacterium]|nr:2-dehydropantoate 2-reductase [Rhodospirillaceae bacterium]MDD9918365.1 2-dehydropantoate 2-reductase [Rhodospirillaceae bacterium]MDD9927245.1 2-dehydropantoate 2-reductase [Rhodospirillaceae bacterium]
MRVIIYGAGGIGGVIGAQLFKADQEVVLIARGPHLEKVQKDGLRYETPNGTDILPLTAVGHPSEIGFRDDDVVLLTMKAQHTLDALDTLRAVAGENVPVICGQNGVANERMALRRFRHVYGMLIYLPSTFLEPGTIQTTSAKTIGVLDTGVFPNGVDDRVETLMAMLEEANFSARPTADIMRWKYGKLMINLGNALNALAPRNDEANPVRELLRAECRAVYAAAGIAYTEEDEITARRGDLMKAGKINGVGRQGDSSWQGLMRGNRDIEADYLNGEIIMLGRLHGVPTPANEVVLRLANRMAREGIAPQSMSAVDLLHQIEEASP